MCSVGSIFFREKGTYPARHVTMAKLVSAKISKPAANHRHLSIVAHILCLGGPLPAANIQKHNLLHVTYINEFTKSESTATCVTPRIAVVDLTSPNLFMDIVFPEWISNQLTGWVWKMSKWEFTLRLTKAMCGGVEETNKGMKEKKYGARGS